MILDLPAAYVGFKRASEHASRQDGRGLPGLLSELVESRTKVALEREWRLTMALVLKQLPSGSCVVARDASGGREWYIGPADQPVTRSLKEAA